MKYSTHLTLIEITHFSSPSQFLLLCQRILKQKGDRAIVSSEKGFKIIWKGKFVRKTTHSGRNHFAPIKSESFITNLNYDELIFSLIFLQSTCQPSQLLLYCQFLLLPLSFFLCYFLLIFKKIFHIIQVYCWKCLGKRNSLTQVFLCSCSCHDYLSNI